MKVVFWRKPMKRIALLIMVILLTACSPKPDLPTDQPISVEPTPTVEAEPTSALTALPEATTEATDAPGFALGTPFLLGHGTMNSAEILAGAQQAAIGQG